MVEILNSIAEHCFDWQVAMLWQTAVLISIIWIVDVIIRKWAHPQVRYALWMLVLVKLLIPPTWTSPASVTSHIPDAAIRAAQSGRSILASEANENRAATVMERAETEVDDTQTIMSAPLNYPGLTATPPSKGGEHVKSSPPSQAEYPEEGRGFLSWKVYAMFIWLAGMLVLSVWLILRLSGLRREHCVSVSCHPGLRSGIQGDTVCVSNQTRMNNSTGLPERFYRQLESAAGKLGLKRLPQVILTNKVACPAVFGVFRPVLLMPKRGTGILPVSHGQDGHATTEHILLHELAHIKRGDLLVHAVWMLVQIVYWFNPLLWMTRRTLQNLRELCCDATVAKLLREDTVHYRQTLLETARQLLAEPVDPGLGLLGLFENSNWLVTRLKWLEKNTWKNRKLRIATIVALIAVMTICVLPMAKAKAKSLKIGFFDRKTLVKFQSADPTAGVHRTIGDTTIDSKTYDVAFRKGEKLLVYAELYQVGKPMRPLGSQVFEGSEDIENLSVTLKSTYLNDGKTSVGHDINVSMNGQSLDIDNIQVHTPTFFNNRYWGFFDRFSVNQNESKISIDDLQEIKSLAVLRVFENSTPDTSRAPRIWMPTYNNVTWVDSNAYFIQVNMFPLGQLDKLFIDAPDTAHQTQLPDGSYMPGDASKEERTAVSQSYLEYIKGMTLPLPEQTANNFTATLPRGGTIRFAGVKKLSEDGKLWYSPDGSRQVEAKQSSSEYSPQPGGNGYEFNVVLETPSNKEIKTTRTRWYFEPKPLFVYGFGQYWSSGVDDLRHAVQFADDVETVDITLEISNGPWNTVAVNSPSGGLIAYIDDKQAVEIKDIHEESGKVTFKLLHPLRDTAHRVVAVLKDGRTRLPAEYREMEYGDVDVRFDGLKLADVRDFQFQTQPTDVVHFSDISLQTGLVTQPIYAASTNRILPAGGEREVKFEVKKSEARSLNLEEDAVRKQIFETLLGWFESGMQKDYEKYAGYLTGNEADASIKDSVEELNELIGLNPDWTPSLLSIHWTDDEAMAVTGKTVKDDFGDGTDNMLVFFLKKDNNRWQIDDIDLEELDGLQVENSRFVQRHPNAHIWLDDPDDRVRALHTGGETGVDVSTDEGQSTNEKLLLGPGGTGYFDRDAVIQVDKVMVKVDQRIEATNIGPDIVEIKTDKSENTLLLGPNGTGYFDRDASVQMGNATIKAGQRITVTNTGSGVIQVTELENPSSVLRPESTKPEEKPTAANSFIKAASVYNPQSSLEYESGSEIVISSDKEEWGEATKGVQSRLRIDSPAWPQGHTPKLFIDLRNDGTRNLSVAIESESWEIEIDGKWYKPNNFYSGLRRYFSLAPGQQQLNVEVWSDHMSELKQLKEGKHTLRVARILPSALEGPLQEQIRVISNPVEIEILSNQGDVSPRHSGETEMETQTIEPLTETEKQLVGAWRFTKTVYNDEGESGTEFMFLNSDRTWFHVACPGEDPMPTQYWHVIRGPRWILDDGVLRQYHFPPAGGGEHLYLRELVTVAPTNLTLMLFRNSRLAEYTRLDPETEIRLRTFADEELKSITMLQEGQTTSSFAADQAVNLGELETIQNRIAAKLKNVYTASQVYEIDKGIRPQGIEDLLTTEGSGPYLRQKPGDTLESVHFVLNPPPYDSESERIFFYDMAFVPFRDLAGVVFGDGHVEWLTLTQLRDRGVAPLLGSNHYQEKLPQQELTSQTQSPLPKEDFDRLDVRIHGTFFIGGGDLTLYGDGKAESSMMIDPQTQTPVRTSFTLTAEQLKKLARLLKDTNWLKTNTENQVAPPDEVTYDMAMVRRGQTYQANCHGSSPEPFRSLALMLQGIHRQEFLYNSLKSSDEQRPIDAAREILGELMPRMGLKSHVTSLMLADVDFNRFQDPFVLWLKAPADHHNDELSAAVTWVGYLKRMDCFEDVLELKNMESRSDWDVICETLLRLGGPQSISALKDIARGGSGGRRVHAVSALIRSGQPGIREILLILDEGILPPTRLGGSIQEEQMQKVYKRWILAESVVRDCMDLWDLPEFGDASKKQIAEKVQELLSSKTPDQWDDIRTEYFLDYLSRAGKLD